MLYRLKRIDPYWIRNPVLPVVAIAAVGAGLAAANRFMFPAAVACGAVGGLALILAVRPAVSAVAAVGGLLASLAGFFLSSDPRVAGLSVPLRLLSSAFSVLAYVALVDGAVLLACVLYNFFAGAAGLAGLAVELEAEGEAGS
ncbi:MAG: hypothetical protein HY552_03260 [Elusimicrobia bacterium]|nr:hypothetical protein [Elusimicrobiota bacterium]